MRWLANFLVSRSRREKLLAKTMAGLLFSKRDFRRLRRSGDLSKQEQSNRSRDRTLCRSIAGVRDDQRDQEECMLIGFAS